jgi:hypothetical protein
MVTTTDSLEKFSDRIQLLQTRKIATFFALTLEKINGDNFVELMKVYAEFLHQEMTNLEAKLDE